MDAVYVYTDGKKELVASTGSNSRIMTNHKLSLQVNTPGEMEMDIPLTSPMRDRIAYLSAEVSFERNGIELFRGYAEGAAGDILTTKTIRTKGVLNYLSRVKMNPFEWHGTVNGFLQMLLDAYNEHQDENRKIYLGSVTVTDANDYIYRSASDRESILSLIMSRLVNKMGGYVRIRIIDEVKYLDYLVDFGRTSRQNVEYGKNLLDIADDIDYQGIATVLIPQGAADEEGNRLTIESVNNGSIYIINEAALEQYGWIEETVDFEDVTEPENLLRKGQALSDAYADPVRTLEVNAVDLSSITNCDRWYLGDIIPARSRYHGLDVEYILTKQEIYALAPENEYMNLGNVRKTYTERTYQAIKDLQIEQDTQKKYNANLNERISNAKGLYTTIEEQEDGSSILWQHDKPNLRDSMLLINVSTVGMHSSPDGGATWYGFDFNGEFVGRLMTLWKVVADDIEGGVLQSIAKDEYGNPITYLDLDNGDVQRFGNIAFIRRESGNESCKWVGEVDG